MTLARGFPSSSQPSFTHPTEHSLLEWPRIFLLLLHFWNGHHALETFTATLRVFPSFPRKFHIFHIFHNFPKNFTKNFTWNLCGFFLQKKATLPSRQLKLGVIFTRAPLHHNYSRTPLNFWDFDELRSRARWWVGPQTWYCWKACVIPFKKCPWVILAILPPISSYGDLKLLP